jgi:hypothetical protein
MDLAELSAIGIGIGIGIRVRICLGITGVVLHNAEPTFFLFLAAEDYQKAHQGSSEHDLSLRYHLAPHATVAHQKI